MRSLVYPRPCCLHAYSPWACITWLLGDTRPDSYFFLKYYMQNCCFVTFSVKVQQWVGLINEITNVKSWIVLKWNYCYSVIAWLESMTRLTIFGNSHSTRVTLRKIVTRLTFLTESLDSTRVTVYDSCQSHFYKISEFLMENPVRLHTRNEHFLLQWWSRLAEIFCFAVWSCYGAF